MNDRMDQTDLKTDAGANGWIRPASTCAPRLPDATAPLTAANGPGREAAVSSVAPPETILATIGMPPGTEGFPFERFLQDRPLGLSAWGWAGVAALLALCWIVTLGLALRYRQKTKRKKEAAPTRTQAPASAHAVGMSIANLHHPGMRDKQEDSFAISDVSDAVALRRHGLLAVVADGMGGLERGEAVSAAVTGTMLRLFPELPDTMTPPQKLLYLAYQANTEACRIGESMPNRGGSTLAAVIVRQNELWFVSIGDSRISLFRNNAAIQLNREHQYAVDLERDAARGSIPRTSAQSDGQRRALTSYIGMPEPAQIDFQLNAVRLLRNDWILLMTDGVFQTLNDDEIASRLYGSVHDAATRIEEAVLGKQATGQDNFTAILFKII